MLGWELPPYNSGGLGVACFHMAQSLSKQGAKIDFVLPVTETEDHQVDFMTISPVKISSQVQTVAKPLAYDTEHVDEVRSIQRAYIDHVIQKVSTDAPDVIHAHDWLTVDAGIAAKKASGAPLVVHVHATEFDRSGGGYGNPIIHEIEQNGLLMADKIVAVSQLTKNLIVSNYNIPAENIEVLHNSIDQSTCLPAENRDMYTYLEKMHDEGYAIVSTLGRLTVQKGLTHFMRAAARASQLYDKFIFVIAGDGEQRDELIRLSADYGIADKVLFTGFVRGDAWRQLYSVSDIFVMSSISEPFGLTVLEAAAHDTSLIVTKQSGVVEVVQSLLKYDYWDDVKLADILINIAVSPALSEELSQGAKAEFKRMSWDDVASKCMSIYPTMRGVRI